MSHSTPIDLSGINFDDDLQMDFYFITVIPETQIEQTSPSSSQRDLSPEETGKCALLELKNPVLRLEATIPLINKTVNGEQKCRFNYPKLLQAETEIVRNGMMEL